MPARKVDPIKREIQRVESDSDSDSDLEYESAEDDWKEFIDPRTKKPYFFSHIRNKSVWTDPRKKKTTKNKAKEANENENKNEKTKSDNNSDNRYVVSATEAAATTSSSSSSSFSKMNSIASESESAAATTPMSSIMGDVTAAANLRKQKRGAPASDHVVEGVGHGLGEINSDDEDNVGDGEGSRFRSHTHHLMDSDTKFYDDELNREPPFFFGYLFKEGGGTSWFGRKTWKKRWVIISGVRLGIFKSQQAYAKGDPPLKNR